jgi:uncharacterized protein YecT (DUF1311 family)
MKKLLLAVLVLLLGMTGLKAGMHMGTGTNGSGSYNSGIDEARYKEYESQLNQVYQQLLKSLDSENQKKLIAGQEEWMKKRDSIVPANPNDPYKEKSAETLARTGVLMMVQKEKDRSQSATLKKK